MKGHGVLKHVYETVQVSGTEVYVTSELTVEEYGYNENIVTIQIELLRILDTGKTVTFPLISYKEKVYGLVADAEGLFREAKASVVWTLKDVGERVGSGKLANYVADEVREMFINSREHFSDMSKDERDVFYRRYMNKQGDGREKEISTTVSKSEDAEDEWKWVEIKTGVYAPRKKSCIGCESYNSETCEKCDPCEYCDLSGQCRKEECERAFHKKDVASESDDANDDYVKRLDKLPEPIRSSMKIVYSNSLKIDAMMNQILEKFSNASTGSVWGTESLDHTRPEDVQKLEGITEQIKQKWSDELLQKLQEVREIDEEEKAEKERLAKIYARMKDLNELAGNTTWSTVETKNEEAGNAEAEAIMNAAAERIEEDDWSLRCAELVKIVQQYDAQGDYVVRSDVSYLKHIARLIPRPLRLELGEPYRAHERRLYIIETMCKLGIDLLKFYAKYSGEKRNENL